jgi:hypothetical protein
MLEYGPTVEAEIRRLGQQSRSYHIEKGPFIFILESNSANNVFRPKSAEYQSANKHRRVVELIKFCPVLYAIQTKQSFELVASSQFHFNRFAGDRSLESNASDQYVAVIQKHQTANRTKKWLFSLVVCEFVFCPNFS